MFKRFLNKEGAVLCSFTQYIPIKECLFTIVGDMLMNKRDETLALVELGVYWRRQAANRSASSWLLSVATVIAAGTASPPASSAEEPIQACELSLSSSVSLLQDRSAPQSQGEVGTEGAMRTGIYSHTLQRALLHQAGGKEGFS